MSNEAKLGSTPLETDGRDAVHIAIVPVKAGRQLVTGQIVKIVDGKAHACANTEEAIGVVDPFLPKLSVKEGETFWLCLYPKTITGLRHVWQHPEFPDVETKVISEEDFAESELWVRTYVANHCHYDNDMPDKGYKSFMENITKERCIFFHGSDCHNLSDVDDSTELFRHLSVLLDRHIDEHYFTGGFRCSC